MPSPVHRARGWCFTINNYDQGHEIILNTLQCRYIVYGREVGELGTPHLQGYVYFENKKTLAAAKRAIGGTGHLSIRRGTHEQARAYCKKDGNYVERGIAPIDAQEARERGGKATAAKWAEIAKNAKLGLLDRVEIDHPKEYVLYNAKLQSMYDPGNTPINGELLHEWWVGPTGTGKSRLLWELYPKHFAKGINKWWDSYTHQQVVAIEEWSPDNIVTANALKRWADRYPFPGEIKGGIKQGLRPKKIIVLSNYTIEQCFPRLEDQLPLKRRFTVINFPGEIQRAKFRAAWFNNPPDEPKEDEDMESTSSTVLMSDEDFNLPNLDLDTLFSQEE